MRELYVYNTEMLHGYIEEVVWAEYTHQTLLMLQPVLPFSAFVRVRVSKA